MTKREKIFEAGAKLFAEHSYNSVGIRDIAREADVNSAMLSYYFGGKAGLLKEIFACFAQRVINIVQKSMNDSSDHHDLVDKSVDSFLTDARENRNIYLVGLRELNHDSPELQKQRENLYNTCCVYFSEFLTRCGANPNKSEEVKFISFTAVLGTVFSDYLLGGGTYIDNDELFTTYRDVVAEILKHGSPALWV
ncbi:TetR family transcriptional regulator [Maridesulfovibrio sp.]|uniref:TetR/AcrR family transcriptional regulator n=1 Tax=Maridesulfovibrio sp. TaxID=2795000 RepID=UPI002A18A187|nr:TetR family transcriptional regulator [Maridesulfovibrio sp.]